MKFKRVRNMLLATALTCSMMAVPVFAAPANTSSLESQKKAAQNEVNSLQSQLSELMSKMTDLQNQLITKGEEITKAEKQLKEAEEKEQQQYEDMKLRIKYMYEEGDGSAVERILSSGSIAEMLNQAEYAQKVHSYDRQMLDEYVETVTEVKELKESLEEDMNKLEDMQTEYEAQQTELNTTIESKSAEVANLDAQIQEAARKAAEEQAAREKAAQEAAKKAEAQQQENNNTPSGNNGGGAAETPAPAPNTPDTPDTPEAPPAPEEPSGGGSSSGNVSAAQTIVSAAWSQIGVPYVWGGTTPYVGLDCSGLTQWCHAQAGIYIGRVDSQQLAGGMQVSDPQPGDIAWTPGHVAIYIGNGQMIEAQQPGTTICVSSVRASAFVRYW
ncbi:MAG: NlpC/P60 family protein [Faecalicatena sp.]|uniref:C40 family peptidase n=1 Tax=Faecalicatena sp. TaxID=2005360 RepID=UPI002582FA97|nr:C40 family peptidase [Faecalicatena sp.]MCI6465061.1 NlpC/P60 family protein [Faecalicatena sp.]MDY5617108.1 NlpC/P60 family protein [Lachnospiraceae bacterium]